MVSSNVFIGFFSTIQSRPKVYLFFNFGSDPRLGGSKRTKNSFFFAFSTLDKGLPIPGYLEYGVCRSYESCKNHTNKISKANFPSSKVPDLT